MTTIYFDLETGGLTDAHPDIQLAAVAVDENWRELESFQVKIQFDESKADPEALKKNHYDREVWAKEAVATPIAVSMFGCFLNRHRSLEMISKRTGMPYSVAKLAAYNAQFDSPRLRRMFGERFLAADPRVRCALQRALWFFDECGIALANYQLSTVAQHFGISSDGAHDALADVRITVAVVRAIQGVA